MLHREKERERKKITLWRNVFSLKSDLHVYGTIPNYGHTHSHTLFFLLRDTQGRIFIFQRYCTVNDMVE